MSHSLSRRPVTPATETTATASLTPASETTARTAMSGPAPDLSLVTPSSDTPMLDGLSGPTAELSPAGPTTATPAQEGPGGVVLTTTLRTGAKGKDVEQLQAFLGLEADGKYGPDTEQAVRAWQAQNGLEVDGVLGPQSRGLLASNAKGVQIGKTLKTGARGKDVEALQQFLGLPVDGGFGPDTRAAVIQFQMDHGLEPDGIIGQDTRTALAGGKADEAVKTGDRAQANPVVQRAEPVRTTGATPPEQTTGTTTTPERTTGGGPVNTPRGELKSRWHNDEAFVPKYASTAYSESGIFRGKTDPYAVGAVSNPTRKQDLGGKTYGVYQFESSIYRDGSTRGKKAVEGSTAMRFMKWEGNPYGKELMDVVNKHGMASAQFDAAWRDIAHNDNKAFGEVQEQFMEVEREKQVGSFFDKIGANESVRKDPRMVDLVMGTQNQYAGLSKGIASYVAARNKDGKLTPDQIGKMIQDYKRARVTSHFKSSPKAHKGIYNRIAREKAMFD